MFKFDKVTNLVVNKDDDAAYNTNGIIASQSGVLAVVKVIDSTNTSVGVVRATPLTLSNATNFLKNGYVYASNGAYGKIISKSGNTIFVERQSPSTFFSSTAPKDRKSVV